MSQLRSKEYRQLIIFDLFMIVFFAVLLLTGTFFDEQIATALFSPDNTLIKFVTSTGVFPFFSFAVFFMGVVCQKLISSDIKKPLKISLCIICIVAAIFVGFIGAGSLFDKDCLGSIYPQLNRNIPAIAGLSVVTVPLLILAGFKLAGRSEDSALVKRVVCVLILLAVSYALLQIFKGTFNRPRYRIVAAGYEGIGFIPWYTPFTRAKEYIELYGIDKGELRSFPSGHSLLSMAVVYILPSLSWFFVKLRDRKLVLSIAGLVFSMIIMFTRMILGAHFLSDVSFGAMIGSVLALLYTVIQNRISVTMNKDRIG